MIGRKKVRSTNRFSKRVIQTIFVFGVLCSPCASIANAENAQTTEEGGFDSTDIASASADAAMDCTNYCVVGVCFFLSCKVFYCDLEYSAKIAHNRPDLNVSTYNHAGDITYTDAADLYGEFMEESGGSIFSMVNPAPVEGIEGGNDQSTHSHNQKIDPSLKVKEASIIGNLSALVSSDYMCESAVTPFMPYYQSELNSIGWRLGLDRLHYLSYSIGSKEVGDYPSYTYGPVYPRIGSVIQKDDFKAASVFAARAMDIFKEGGMGHVRYELTNSHVTQSGHEILEEDNPWQPLFPSVESSCSVLGVSNDENWLKKHRGANQKNGWIFWQRYKCCAEEKGAYIGSAEFPPICSNAN